MKLLRIVYLVVFLLFSFSSCSLSASLPRVPSLEEKAKVQNLIDKAKVEIQLGQIEKAKTYVEIAAALAPNEPSVVDARGCIAWYYQDYLTAKKHFNNAILLDQGFENAYVNLAYIEEQKGSIVEAKKILEQVLRINPLNYKARNNYAALLYDNFDKQEAKSHLQMAIAGVNETGKVDRILISNKRLMLE